MKRLFISCVALLALQAGCSSVAHYPGTVDCRNSLQSDLLRFFAIDEFSMEYMRNTFYYCNDGGCANQQSAASLPPSLAKAPASSISDVQVQSPSARRTADSQPLVKDLK
jgi:hypothetical protein